MDRELLICTNCKSAIFINSVANKAPRWTGEIGDPPNTRIEIDCQDDLRAFKQEHLRHGMIEVELAQD